MRWLVLWEHEFGTLDPTSSSDTTTTTTTTTTSTATSGWKETNRWPYRCLLEWMAVPNEPQTILLQIVDAAGSETTLKLWCHSAGLEREWILTRLLRQQDRAGQANTTSGALSLFHAQRGTRHGTLVPVVLQVKPYGITEWHHGGAATQQQQVLQTYYYCDIRAVSFPSTATTSTNTAATASDPHHNPEQQQNGIFLYFRQPHKIRLYIIDPASGGGRTAFLKSISSHYPTLGLDPLPMQPSMTLQQWWTQRQQLQVQLGPTALQWTVTKTSRRHDSTVVGTTDNRYNTTLTPGGVVVRQLRVTGHGYLVEADENTSGGGGIVHAHLLTDLCAIVRSSHDNTLLQLEFVHHKIYTYTMAQHRDAVIVSLLDAASQQQQQQQANRNNHQARAVVVHVTDRPSAGYRLLGYGGGSNTDSTDPQPPKQDSKVKSLFQPTPIPLLCLKRVYTLSLHCFAVASGELGSEPQHASPQHRRELRQYVARLHVQPDVLTLVTACREFNANVVAPPQRRPDWSIGSGGTVVEKHIIGSMGALFGLVGKLLAAPVSMEEDGRTPPPVDARVRRDREQVAGTMLQTLYRLAQTVTGYRCSAELSTLLRDCLPTLWSIQDTYCQFGAYSVLNALLSGTNVGSSSTPGARDREAEYVNKNVLLQSGGPALVNGLVSSLLPGGGEDGGSEYYFCNGHSTSVMGHAAQSTMSSSHQHVSDLILMVTSDILQSLLCSYHDTTSPEHFQHLITALSNRYRALLSLLRSPTPFVTENTALLLHLLSTHAPAAAAAIREAALSSAISLQHFYLATFSPLEGQRFLSRYLCSLWFSGPPGCDEKRLLKRMVPHGFLAYLNMPPLSLMEEEQLDQLERDAVENNISEQAMTNRSSLGQEPQWDATAATAGGAGTNTARLRSRIALAAAMVANKGSRPENFRIFFHVLTQDHSLADLIWSQQTRRELRIALESELDYIRRETDARGGVLAWNHQQFRVDFPSLDSEVKVGNIYMRLWLQAGDGFIRSWEEPVRLFEHLFRRFLCEVERDPKVSSA